MAAALGLATWFTHGGIPPGAGFGSVSSGIRVTLQAPGFVFLVIAFAALVGAGWRLVVSWLRGHGDVARQQAVHATVPLVWGMALPMLAPLLDAASFWCSAPALAALGIGTGALLSARRCARLGAFGHGEFVHSGRASVAVLAAAIPLLLLAGGWSPPSGDEPHYLVVAHSLVTDNDLDLADDYRERVYASFHPTTLSPHYKPGQQEGSRYSMHGVGLPLFLAPAYALGRALGSGADVALTRALLALLFGLFAWILYGFIRDVSSARAAVFGTLATTLLAPLLFAPLFLFPEVPAMVLSLFAFRHLRTPAPVAGETRCGLALALLPFVGVKYIPLAFALFIVGIWSASGGRTARLVRVGGPLSLGLLTHALFTWWLYGSLSPAAIYLGAGEQAGAPALGGNWSAYVAAWPAALATAIGFLLDQKEGLLAYGPHFLLAAFGLAWMWRRERRLVLSLGLVAAAYVGPYALSQQLGGQGPPVRPLMAVLWVLAPALGVALAMDTASRAYAALRGGLVALAASLTVAYAAQPQLLPHDYPVVASRLLQNYSPYGSDWWRMFPQWVSIEVPNWGATGLWTLLTFALGVVLWRHGWRSAAGDVPRPGEAEGAVGEVGWRAATAVTVMACLFVLSHHLLVVRTDRHRPTPMDGGLVAWVAEELPAVAFAEPAGIWATPGVPVDLVLTSEDELESLDVSLRVLEPANVAVSIQGALLVGASAPGRNLVARLRPRPGRSDGGSFAYQVRLYANRGAAPADLFGGADERYLGVFLQALGGVER